MALGENHWTFPSFCPSHSLLPIFLPPWCRTEFPAVVSGNDNAVNIYCWCLHLSNTFLALESQLVSVKNRHCLIPSMMCYNGSYIVVISYSDIFISYSCVLKIWCFDLYTFVLYPNLCPAIFGIIFWIWFYDPLWFHSLTFIVCVLPGTLYKLVSMRPIHLRVMSNSL